MNILKRELAPISQKGWDEIEDLARETLKASLSARKFVDVIGPKGLHCTSVSTGRLDVPAKQKDQGVNYGIYSVLPLTETRVRFSLASWELDNIERGASDAELDSLVTAAQSIAKFEEEAVYHGFPAGCITGLYELAADSLIPMKLTYDGVVDAVTSAQRRMLDDGVAAPANLAAGPDVWQFLARSAPGGSLRSLLEKQINGKVILAPALKGALLAADRGGDFELTIGQDFAIGYHSHTTEAINLFMMESFTFRIITPEAVVGFSV